MIDCPRQLCTDSADYPRLDRLESSVQVAMSAHGEAREIVCCFVHVLHERHLGVHDPVGLEYPMDLIHNTPRLDNVLEDCLNPNTLDGLIG